MSDQRQTTPSLNSFVPPALSAWWSGFDYVFGYQLKLIHSFWGLPDNNIE